MTEWVLVLVFYGTIAATSGTFANEEECHVTGKKWIERYKVVPNRVNYACLPANFMNVK